MDSGPLLLPRLTASHALAPVWEPLGREGAPVITGIKYPDSWVGRMGAWGQNEWAPRQWFSPRGDFAPRGHFAMSRDFFCVITWRVGALLRPGMLLNSLECAR